MQINLTGHHVEITPSLRDYVNGKLDKIERRNDQITSVHVILSVEKLRQKAEAKIHFGGGDIFADAEHEDMYAAIDALLDKLVRQVKRHKERQVDRNQSAEDV